MAGSNSSATCAADGSQVLTANSNGEIFVAFVAFEAAAKGDKPPLLLRQRLQYCQPKSNIVRDPRFTTVGSDKALWAITSNVTDNFEPMEFSDGSPGGLYLPSVGGGGSGATIEQDVLLSRPGALYDIYTGILIKNSSLPYDMVIFRLRIWLSNTSDYATTFYDAHGMV
ncbi:hypothetical protein POJ06DRAFT_241220 [Lipomyces tetrasporus]|uniref:Uncharacterized protein n=1 Tax=Lipomyces tetrasporus TaxID=54092 RepID=A0AAD7QL05_9ASCO|nr:uncharacterized protein POJ06DRAFT_241220 [Lipomyces tetrasporus]KAJ8097220.1 hypothetical protein POJ06DRAFT_241220 [Lipomyces tetrasporus]